jgi:lysozyme
LTVPEAEFLLKSELEKLNVQLSFHKVYKELDDIAKAVILDMAYNMGYAGIMTFKKMWIALEQKDYKEASKEMLDSKWAKQVPHRAIKLSEIMKKGEI